MTSATSSVDFATPRSLCCSGGGGGGGCRPPGRTSESRCSSNTAQTPTMLWRGHMLARLVCSESFWAVVKVRSPHTVPEVWYPRTTDGSVHYVAWLVHPACRGHEDRGALYAAEWPCCHDPLRFSPCSDDLSPLARQPFLLIRASAEPTLPRAASPLPSAAEARGAGGACLAARAACEGLHA